MRIVKIKDLSNTIAAALFCPLEAFVSKSGAKPNGYMSGYDFGHESQPPGSNNLTKAEAEILIVDVANSSSSPQIQPVDVSVATENDSGDCRLSLR